MRRSAKWTVAILVAATVLASGAWYTWSGPSPAARLATLPVREQNLIVYDGAITLLEANYYDPSIFEKPDWKEFKAHWRDQVAAYPGRGIWLYLNVLNNFESAFPSSHLHFEIPRGVPPPAPEQKDQKRPAYTKKFFKAFDPYAASGFDSVWIRRGNIRREVVTEVRQGSPAERAGVTPGWALANWTYNFDEGGGHFKGTFFTLAPENAREFERSGLPFPTTSQAELDAFSANHSTNISFDYEPLPRRMDFETRKLGNGATYLRFDTFNDWGIVSRAIDVIDAAGPAGLVLDLRRNQGGLMLHMMRINGRLLGDDVQLGTTRGRDSSSPVRALKFGKSHYQAPLMVLIGPASSSAAEITAAAIKHHRRGTLIGRTTNGSVLSGRKFELPDGGTIVIPVKDFLTPDDRHIEATGVEPDIWVLPTLEDVRAGRDPVLERAIRELDAAAGRGS